MSKTTILLALIVLAAGLVVGIYIIPRVPLYLADYTLIWSDIQTIPTLVADGIPKAVEFIKQNIIGAVGVFVTMFAGLWKLYTNMRQQGESVKQNLEGQLAQSSTMITQLEDTKTQLETEITDQKDQIINLQDQMLKDKDLAISANTKLLSFQDRYKQLEQQLADTQKALEVERAKIVR